MTDRSPNGVPSGGAPSREAEDTRRRDNNAAKAGGGSSGEAGKSEPATQGHGDDPDEGQANAPKKKGLLERPLLLTAGGVLLLAAIIGGLLFWLYARQYEGTDDAFVDTHLVRLAPQISGRVTQVLVKDNQLVSPNQPLVTIDSADIQTRVAQAGAQKAQAEAQLENAQVQVAVNQATYEQAMEDARASQAPAVNAARDLARYLSLQQLNASAVSQQQVDQARSLARQTAAQRDAALRLAKSRADQIIASRTQVAAGKQQLRAAQSVLDEADLNLSYTRITAPVRGNIAQKTVAVGNYVSPGTLLMAIVPLSVWITANFKETQLALMRPGQAVAIKVDACPQAKIDGHVDSIQRGAGQAFSILPSENATGNYVKVVQRVPVKIVLDHLPPDCPLGPGMSVEPSVKVR